MDSNDIERAAIEAAMRRLLAGTPARSSGSLSILTLAQEAGLKRNKLTHKHTDLRDQFRAEVAQRDGVTEREIKLRDDNDLLRTQLDQVTQQRDGYRATSEVFARAMNVLTVENISLRKELSRNTAATVIPIVRPR